MEDNTIQLYPEINDDLFNLKISSKKEFIDTHNNNIYYKENTKLRSFSLKSHQLFVKNFLSKNTPYNN